MTLVDDPTLKEFQGKALLGNYAVDDEGVKAERVTLVDNGILRNLLMSRRPGPDFQKSNGHARSAMLSDTMPLPSNLSFQASDSLDAGALKKKFLDACHNDGHEWCLEIKRMDNPALSSIRQEDFNEFIGSIAGGLSSGERMPSDRLSRVRCGWPRGNGSRRPYRRADASFHAQYPRRRRR